MTRTFRIQVLRLAAILLLVTAHLLPGGAAVAESMRCGIHPCSDQDPTVIYVLVDSECALGEQSEAYTLHEIYHMYSGNAPEGPMTEGPSGTGQFLGVHRVDTGLLCTADSGD